MSGKYAEFAGLNLPSIEKNVLANWQKNKAFEQSIILKEGAPAFVFYEGPPSANGMPGIHHVISRTLKDLVCRYKTMQGFQVKRKGGWDTHGLPVELGVEKELGITKEDIGVKISVEDYNKKCREAVLRYKKEWDDITTKMGYWVDLETPYITFDSNYIESLWWILSKMYNRGLLYESVSIQPYSPAAGTGLSSHELNQPGTYKDVKDTSAVVMFKATRNEKSTQLFSKVSNDTDIFFTAWTTTPWTLPSNLGLTVGPNIVYQLIKTRNPYSKEIIQIILSKKRFTSYFSTLKTFEVGEGTTPNVKDWGRDLITDSKGILPFEILAEFEGKDLEGLQYEQLLPYTANSLEAIIAATPNAQPFQVMCDAFVTTEDGTGIVHTAPAFGADDYKVGKKYNIGILVMVDKEGKFVDGLGEFSNRYVKNYKDEVGYVDVNVDICVKLKKENRAFKVEKYEHSYPHCWRTDKPILYYPLDAWFIKTTALKDRMVEQNKTINWKPKSTGEGRFGNWLENMVDWNLSRSRFWGTPLPIWRSSFKMKESFFPNNNDYFKPKMSLCLGNRLEFLKTNSKDENTGKEFEVYGYYFDLDSINNELRKGESNMLFEKWRSYELGFEGEIDRFLNAINFDSLKEKLAQNQIISLEDLCNLHLTLNLLDGYYKKIDEKYLETLDFHKPMVDNIGFSPISGEFIMYRVPDLIDVWFDSGAMPYAQHHFPFENKELFAQNYPANFIAEGVDQTRGWFYTLHAIAALIKEDVQAELAAANLPATDEDVPGLAYKTVVSNGLVLDKNGNKMSKRLGNVINPFETIEKYGADATRWYLITNASPWDNLKFDINGIQEVQRKFFGTIYNTYQFFTLYANLDNFSFEQAYIAAKERPEIDQWILSTLHTLIEKVTAAFEDYEPTVAGRLIETFVDEHLSNWYVRLCRRRFWKGDYEHDKQCAYQTLYECLETITLLIAPISPFFSDAVFCKLNDATKRFAISSVHHAKFPTVKAENINKSLEERMLLAQDICSLVLSLRKKVNIKVRQPLQKLLIPVLNASMQQQLQAVEDLIKAEVNVKEIVYLSDTEGFIKKKAKPNFKALGGKLGKHMKAVTSALAAFNQQDITILETTKKYDLVIDGETIILALDEVEILAEDIEGWSVASKGTLTVALDIVLTESLKQEGDARELINRIQNLRKEQNFDLTDRIELTIEENAVLKNSIEAYSSYICHEILADNINWVASIEGGTVFEINNISLKISVLKKG